MFQNLLFDLDGTLTNSAEGITKCVQYALHANGIDEPDLKKLEVFIGPSLRDSFKKFYGLSPEQIEIGINAYRERYTKIGIWENKVYPGMLELLESLKANGHRLGMATAKPEVFALQIAERFGFNQYLQNITGSTLDGKMDDKAVVVELALKKWQISTPEEKLKVALIGDRREDVLAAHANGIACIGVGFGFGSYEELMQAKADYYVKDIAALKQLLLNKSASTLL